MQCVNLRKRFGQRFKVRLEESYCAERGGNARADDPALQILLCRFGHLYPWSGSTLAASVDGHPVVAKRLKRLPCVWVHQDGDSGELTVLFDVADFDRVAAIMQPRRRVRRNLTAKQRAEVAERLRRGRENARQSLVESESTAPGRLPAVAVV